VGARVSLSSVVANRMIFATARNYTTGRKLRIMLFLKLKVTISNHEIKSAFRRTSIIILVFLLTLICLLMIF
jgi:hypothetical protein